mmetsp:Transcript_54993/g.143540  ORF Transcript_54993/g.143540 Transcript_54993/m.143540 type:complete len:248 (+) Transcript_54993:247-990(+)
MPVAVATNTAVTIETRLRCTMLIHQKPSAEMFMIERAVRSAAMAVLSHASKVLSFARSVDNREKWSIFVTVSVTRSTQRVALSFASSPSTCLSRSSVSSAGFPVATITVGTLPSIGALDQPSPAGSLSLYGSAAGLLFSGALTCKFSTRPPGSADVSGTMLQLPGKVRWNGVPPKPKRELSAKTKAEESPPSKSSKVQLSVPYTIVTSLYEATGAATSLHLRSVGPESEEEAGAPGAAAMIAATEWS